jgi:2-C-methyl-D-erythritol 4-phosphate cytidylyltransferase
VTAIKKYVIIVAGGTGKRMGGEIPKQFLPLSGKPMLMHSIRAFFDYSPDIQIILVLHPDFMDYWDNQCRQYGCPIPHRIVAGGERRFDSVKNGLEAMQGKGLVAVHDAVRPLVSAKLIADSYSEAALYGSTVPVVPLNDTIREISTGTSRVVNRTNLFMVQTPQVFSLPALKDAYRQPYSAGFTDDAAVIEASGGKINFIPGEPDNFKITFPEDIVRAEMILKERP